MFLDLLLYILRFIIINYILDSVLYIIDSLFWKLEFWNGRDALIPFHILLSPLLMSRNYNFLASHAYINQDSEFSRRLYSSKLYLRAGNMEDKNGWKNRNSKRVAIGS